MKQATSFIDPLPDGDDPALEADPQADENVSSAQRGSKKAELLSLVGQEPRSAIERLRDLELVPAPDSEEIADPEQVGVVVRQFPPAGTVVGRGDVVELVIGRAPTPPTIEEAPGAEGDLDEDDWFDVPVPSGASDAQLSPFAEPGLPESTADERQSPDDAIASRARVSRKRRRPVSHQHQAVSLARTRPLDPVRHPEEAGQAPPVMPAQWSRLIRPVPVLAAALLVFAAVLLVAVASVHRPPASSSRSISPPSARVPLRHSPPPEVESSRRAPRSRAVSITSSPKPGSRHRRRVHRVPARPTDSDPASVRATPAPSVARTPVDPCELCLEHPSSP